MTYVEGFVTAVPVANRDAYLKHAISAVPLFREFGATRFVEAWADDVPKGKLTDFAGAVRAKDDEAVLFSWLEYPDKATRDAATERMMSDPRMAEFGQDMPFDGSRMIYAGFAVEIDTGRGAAPGYVDGFVAPVSPDKKQAYFEMARKAAPVFLDYGAIRVVEAWGDNLSHGKQTDYYRAVRAQGDENVVYSWIEWPSKEARVAGWAKAMTDERMKPDPDPPFDGKRMFYGGFAPILDQ